MLSKIKANLAPWKRRLLLASVPASLMVTMAVPAFASVGGSSFDLAALMGSAAEKIVADLLSMIATVLPTAIILFGASIGITFGIKFLRKIFK